MTRFDQVLVSLKGQSLNKTLWELIIVDNNSNQPIDKQYDISWQPNSKCIFESKPGLSHARIKGVSASNSELIIFVDDDNILQQNFLELASKYSNEHPKLGCFGGKSIPKFEEQPADWFYCSGINLGCQDLGNQPYISNYESINFDINEYPAYAPIGTGMVIKKEAFLVYHNEVKNSSIRLALGRKGITLTSGEDNDIVITVVKAGYEIGYFPNLEVTHIIPKTRLSLDYLKKMAFESNRSWVKVLHVHHLNPWKPISKIGYILRFIRAYFRNKPWIDENKKLEWYINTGRLKGLSELL